MTSCDTKIPSLVCFPLQKELFLSRIKFKAFLRIFFGVQEKERNVEEYMFIDYCVYI